MRERYEINQINRYLRSCLPLSIKLVKTVSTKHGIDLLQNNLNEYANNFGICIDLGIPLDQDVLVAYASLRKAVTKLNEVNRGYNDGRDILTFPSPYIKHHDDIYNVTIFPIPKPEDTSGLSISTDSSEYNDHNSSNGIADGGINYSINQMMDHDIVDATQEGINESGSTTSSESDEYHATNGTGHIEHGGTYQNYHTIHYHVITGEDNGCCCSCIMMSFIVQH
jgi:hypothetical protein